jgi:hypothetical protein
VGAPVWKIVSVETINPGDTDLLYILELAK